MSDRFRQAGINGASATRLKLYRQFYRQSKPICPTPPDQFLLPAFEFVETREIHPKLSDATSSHIGTAAAVDSALCFDRLPNCQISGSTFEDYVQMKPAVPT